MKMQLLEDIAISQQENEKDIPKSNVFPIKKQLAQDIYDSLDWIDNIENETY